MPKAACRKSTTCCSKCKASWASRPTKRASASKRRKPTSCRSTAILQTIDRISETTSFQGTKLLNGNFDFNIENQDVNVTDIEVNGAKIPQGESRALTVNVTASAQNAGLFLSAAATGIDTASGETLTIDLSGTTGSREFSFASGTSLENVAATINTFTDLTGLSAVASGAGVRINSVELGDSEFVSVDIRDDAGVVAAIRTLSATDSSAVATADTGVTFAAAANPIRDEGQDIAATINGVRATTRGSSATIATDFLDVTIDLNTTGAQTLGAVGGANGAGTITGGGANFNLGPNVDIGNQVSIGIQSIASRNLGSETDGFLSSLASGADQNVVDGDLTQAQRVVNDAIGQVSKQRGRLGAFTRNTVGSTIRSLGVALENTSAAESAIRDTDFAKETAELTRSQILVQAATNSLSIANSNPQNALALLN